MKPHRISAFFALLSMLWLSVAPAWGVNKEMVQLQTQVQQLQEQMTAMQRSFDERMGVMRNLVEQDTDAVNKVANCAELRCRPRCRSSRPTADTKIDQLSGQIQALNDTMDEIQGRAWRRSPSSWKTCRRRSRACRAAGHAASAAAGAGSRPRLRTCSTTTLCAITTAARTIWRRRNSPIT